MLMPTREQQTNLRRFTAGALSGVFDHYEQLIGLTVI